MIKKYSLIALEKTINRALKLDPDLEPKLSELDKVLIKIIIRPLKTHFYLQFNKGTISLLAESEKTPNTTIESSPLGLIRLSILPSSKVRSLFNNDIKISGNVEIGHKVKKIFDEVEIDWEGHLANFTGDIVAFQMGSLFRKGLSFQKQFTASLEANLTEFLQEELRWFPSKEEVEDFFNDVDDLAIAADRLISKVAYDQKKNENNKKNNTHHSD